MHHKIVTYPAIFKPLGDDMYVINFPDIKGAITEGQGLRNSIKLAVDTLGSRLYSRRELPAASKVEDIEVKDDTSFVVPISADLTAAGEDRIRYQI